MGVSVRAPTYAITPVAMVGSSVAYDAHDEAYDEAYEKSTIALALACRATYKAYEATFEATNVSFLFFTFF